MKCQNLSQASSSSITVRAARRATRCWKLRPRTLQLSRPTKSSSQLTWNWPSPILQRHLQTAFGGERNGSSCFPTFCRRGGTGAKDIPRLVAAAAKDHPNIEWLVTAPFGLHSGISGIISDRIAHCLNVANQGEGSCDACSAENPCQFGNRSAAAE